MMKISVSFELRMIVGNYSNVFLHNVHLSRKFAIFNQDNFTFMFG